MKPPLVILDTCICLDLFLYEDRNSATLLSALRAGRVTAVTNEACRGEWQRVLAYPKLKVEEARRPEIEARHDALVRLLSAGEAPPRSDVELPQCADPDDQKFLELARDSGAIALVTKDRLLLRLWRRLARAGLFAVVPPELTAHQNLGDPAFWTSMLGGEARRTPPRR